VNPNQELSILLAADRLMTGLVNSGMPQYHGGFGWDIRARYCRSARLIKRTAQLRPSDSRAPLASRSQPL
jgi:hypothetical protein